MAAELTVICPTSRPVANVLQVIRDFKNQTYRDFELLIIRDGPYPEGWEDAVQHVLAPNMHYTCIPKSNDKYSGTTLRNKGIELCKTRWISFFDDDDRAKDCYLEYLMSSNHSDRITVTQMAIPKSKVNGKQSGEITIVPESVLTMFPVLCHCGTPTAAVKTVWAQNFPWQDIPNHDYEFYAEIIKWVKPPVSKIEGAVVDVDGCLTKGLKDWVSKPPFYRG